MGERETLRCSLQIKGGSREGAEVLNALHSDGPLYNK